MPCARRRRRSHCQSASACLRARPTVDPSLRLSRDQGSRPRSRRTRRPEHLNPYVCVLYSSWANDLQVGTARYPAHCATACHVIHQMSPTSPRFWELIKLLESDTHYKLCHNPESIFIGLPPIRPAAARSPVPGAACSYVPGAARHVGPPASRAGLSHSRSALPPIRTAPRSAT